MGFSIDQFKAQGLPRGGARANLFKVRFAAIPPGVADASLDLEYVVRAASVPASTIDPVEVPYFGRKIQLAGNRTFQPWTITIMNDEGMRHRNMFEAWHNKINSLISNRQDSGPDDMLDYKVPANVLQFGKAGPGDDTGIIRGYQFEGLFPIDVGQMQLDWEANDAIQQFDCTFAFDYFIPIILDRKSTRLNSSHGYISY